MVYQPRLQNLEKVQGNMAGKQGRKHFKSYMIVTHINSRRHNRGKIPPPPPRLLYFLALNGTELITLFNHGKSFRICDTDLRYLQCLRHLLVIKFTIFAIFEKNSASTRPWSMFNDQLSLSSSKAVTVECNERNPDWRQDNSFA